MQAKRKIYSILWNYWIAPTLGVNNLCFLRNRNREFAIRSVTWDLRIRNYLAPYTMIPLEENQVLEYGLDLEPFPINSLIASTYEDMIPAINAVQNGTVISLHRPGKRNFEDFFIQNEMRINSYFVNYDMLNTLTYFSSVIIEIEEL